MCVYNTLVIIEDCFCAGIESLLTTLRSLNEKVGTYEEEEEFKLLESILQSSKFKKAKEVINHTLMC